MPRYKPTEWMQENDKELYDHIMSCDMAFCTRVRAFIIVVERYQAQADGIVQNTS